MRIKSQPESIPEIVSPWDGPATATLRTIPSTQTCLELHLLLVEPARDEREMYAEYLRNRGVHVTSAAGLRQAIDIARARRPHVIVIEPCWRHSTDRGLALIRSLRADPRTEAIPIVAVSGHAFPHERAAALDAGCESFFQKPCTPARLEFELERLSWRYSFRRLSKMPLTR